MKGVEQQKNGADADDGAEDERVPSLPQVDSLDQIVDGRKTIGQCVDPALDGFQHAPLGGHVLLGRHGNARKRQDRNREEEQTSVVFSIPTVNES